MKNQPEKVPEITPLARFCRRHNLSYQKLSDICGNAPNLSKSSLGRLGKNQIEDHELEAGMKTALAGILPQYLLGLGLSAAEIDDELLQIFTNGEYQPMINQRTVLPEHVQNFFNLSGDPFSKPPSNRDEVFISPALQEVVDRALDIIRYPHKNSFCYISGDIGSGKTVVRAIIEDEVQRDKKLALIFPETADMSRVTPASISRAILEHYDVNGIPNDAVQRFKKVKNTLLRVYNEGIRSALGFDECHRLNDAALSSLKNFLEMNSGGFQQRLAIILFGQPSIEARLREFRFREVVERITPIHMPEFSESAADYLRHRLALVGGNSEDLFDADAIALIVQQAKTPLALGNIANSAMIISAEEFKNPQVIGEAIKTKMYFTKSEQKAVPTRRAS